ncbi:DNA adenine methylase [Paenibacillus alkalitolerans]|uniref:DNA adenine methylase n=1 Tax=Paenibacillus alkalitolerans TaxID=2799335 RepID=UPI0018F6C223|nr:DNA adenine methylase [Paenibacillus alkalitolerans]
MTTAIQTEVRTHCPIRWFGGKFLLCKHIIPLFPKHHCFVDVFGGGGSVTCAKPKRPNKI